MYDRGPLVSSLALPEPTGNTKLIPSFFHTMTCPHQTVGDHGANTSLVNKAPSPPLARVALVALVVPYVAAAFYFATKAADKK